MAKSERGGGNTAHLTMGKRYFRVKIAEHEWAITDRTTGEVVNVGGDARTKDLTKALNKIEELTPVEVRLIYFIDDTIDEYRWVIFDKTNRIIGDSEEEVLARWTNAYGKPAKVIEMPGIYMAPEVDSAIDDFQEQR